MMKKYFVLVWQQDTRMSSLTYSLTLQDEAEYNCRGYPHFHAHAHAHAHAHTHAHTHVHAHAFVLRP